MVYVRYVFYQQSELAILLLATLIALNIGCEKNQTHTTPLLNSVLGGRVAAVLMTQNNGSADAQGNLYPGQSSDNSGQNVLSGNTQTGVVEILSVYENEASQIAEHVGYGDAYRQTGLTSGAIGRPTGYTMTIPGISADPIKGSQIVSSSDGSLLWVSQTNAHSVLPIRIAPNGQIIGAYPAIATGNRPTRLAAARTVVGELLAVVTAQGISIIYTGSGANAARSAGMNLPSHPSMPVTDVAFLPGGEYLAVSQTHTSGGSGRVLFCHVRNMLINAQTPFQTATQMGTLRGCSGVDPGLVASMNRATEFSVMDGVGTQVTPGVPWRLAINQNLAVYLTPNRGVGRLQTPNTGDINPYADEVLQVGYGNRYRYNRANISYNGFAILPTNNVLVTSRNLLHILSMNNALEQGTPISTIEFSENLYEIASDPGYADNPNTPEFDPNFGAGSFALITTDRNKVYVATHAMIQSLSLNPLTDFIGLSGLPISVVIVPLVANNTIFGVTKEKQTTEGDITEKKS